MEVKFRALALVGFGRLFEQTLSKHMMREGDGMTPSCLSCEHFKESTEECNAANGQRPPARIIAFGCNVYRDRDDIPF